MATVRLQCIMVRDTCVRDTHINAGRINLNVINSESPTNYFKHFMTSYNVVAMTSLFNYLTWRQRIPLHFSITHEQERYVITHLALVQLQLHDDAIWCLHVDVEIGREVVADVSGVSGRL